MAKQFSNEQAAEMLRTTPKEVKRLARELDVPDDEWTVQDLADADEELEPEEDNDDDEPEGGDDEPEDDHDDELPRLTATAHKALGRARKLIAQAGTTKSEDLATQASVRAVEIIAKYRLLEYVGRGGGRANIEHAVSDGLGSVLEAVASAIGPGLRRALRKGKD